MEHNPSAGAEIVKEAYDLITGQRQNDYSHPLEDYRRTVNIYNALMGEDVMTVEDGILFMVCMKLSRLINEIDNQLDVPDNTRDAIGYLGCLQMARVALKKNDDELSAIIQRIRMEAREGDYGVR